MAPKIVRKRRQRRSTEEVVNRLVRAAGEEFERNGYAGTKTAAIARKAGVTEALIFSNFGSKARLFHDSIFKPLNQHFLEFQATHVADADDADALRRGTQEYIRELEQFIRRHSRMLMSLVVAQMYPLEDVEGVGQVQGLHDYFARATAASVARHPGKPKIDPRIMARVSFATILACTLFKDWLFPDGLATDGQISRAVSDYVMDGLSANAKPGDKAAKPGGKAAKPRRTAHGSSRPADPRPAGPGRGLRRAAPRSRNS